MEFFTNQHLVETVRQIKELMEKNKDYLIELDSAIGDGDLGLTMTKGFIAAWDTVQTSPETDLGFLCKRIGFAISKAAPSTMGTLLAIGFIGAGKELEGNDCFNADQIARFFRSMAESISLRSKAKEGDKTLLDVLFPVARAVESCGSPDIGIRMKIAVEAAKHSLEQTRPMMNQHGKAAVFREKTIGFIDPGAAAACIMIEAFAQACPLSV